MRFTKLCFKLSIYFVSIALVLTILIILGHKAYNALFAESYSAFKNPWGQR